MALLGPHCYSCGQPVKGLVRHFTSIIGDFFDSVFDFDSRTLRTLWPLFARPGYLTCEYFEGRRVRYVSPVRLFFFLTIVAFFVGSLTLHMEGDGIEIDDNDRISQAMTVAEVEKLRDEALAKLPRATDDEGRPAPGIQVANEAKRGVVTGLAAERIVEIRKAEEAGEPVPVDDDEWHMNFGDGNWDPETNPVEVSFLPAFADDWINAQLGRVEKNIERSMEDPELYMKAVLSAVPTSLFVLLPVFALMLKLAYVFKRRLYMEHLIVALHSHAFLSLSLLLLLLLGWLEDLLPAAASIPFNIAEFLLAAWMPLYLLRMQKRVYGQGWPMTLLKYLVLGFLYFNLITIGAVFVAVASLVWM
ncbi:MAG TPA: DUF3667 domain-containing protein [Xanthomonadaceae bacterium]|nr:DUF3667 domain-containing protein [Xanthomonadaceae bacterium]